MKVLLITNLFPNKMEPNRGIFVKQSAVHLAKLCELVVVAPVNWFPPLLKWPKSMATLRETPREETIDGIRVLHPRWFAVPSFTRLFNGFLMFFGLISCVQRLKNEFDFDVIYAHWLFPDGFAASLISLIVDKPLLLHAHGCDVNHYFNDRARKLMIMNAIGRARGVSVVSRQIRERLINAGVPAGKISFIPNGIDRSLFRPIPMYEARKKLDLSPEEFIFLFIGSFEMVKGVDVLIKALAGCLRAVRRDDVRLYLVGHGSREGLMRALVSEYAISDKVHFVGSVQHTLIPLWMNAANILCLPSIREGIPNVVLESQSCGRPVIASRVGGIPDIINSEDYGLLALPNNVFSLSDALVHGLTKPWDDSVIIMNPMLMSWKYHAELKMSFISLALGRDLSQLEENSSNSSKEEA